MGKEALLAVGLDESVPEKGGGSENAVEDGGGVRKRVGAGNEEGNEEVILLEASVDDASVHLLEMFTVLAGFEKSGDGGS